MIDSVLPDSVIVELTNSCNLNCPLCSTAKAMKRPRGFMGENLFKKLADELGENDSPPEMALTMCGEPLLHPQVSDLIGYASKNSIPSVISTNATLMTEALSGSLIRAGLSKIYLCVDGFSKISHEAYRVGSDFHQVKENCEKFLEKRAQCRSKTPKVIIQTLITSFNENELASIQQWAKEIGADALYMKTLSLGTHLSAGQQEEYKHLLPRQESLRRSEKCEDGLCRRFGAPPIVYWNGDVGLCCIDYNNEFSIGNITQNGLKDVLGASHFQTLCGQAQKRELSLCRRCRATTNRPGFQTDFL